MKYSIYYLLALTLALSLLSCEKFNYSPYAFDPQGEVQDVNELSLNTLTDHSEAETDTINFVLLGDVQNFYDETHEIVQAINESDDIDFVIQDGDITDFGTETEFLDMNQILSSLHVPYFTVIGNHDCIANGAAIYEQVFGPLNYSFIYKRVKFIFINTNSREFNFDGSVPNVDWLEMELADSPDYDNAVVICHVPPGDVDFDSNLTQRFIETLGNNPKVLMELNGHRHSFAIDDHERIPYITSNSAEKLSYIRISIWKDNFFWELVQLQNGDSEQIISTSELEK